MRAMLSAIASAVTLIVLSAAVWFATAPQQSIQRWSEVAEVIALDRFVPDTFGPPIPIVRLRLDSGALVTAPLPSYSILQAGKAVELTATRTRFGRVSYKLNESALAPQRRAG